MILRETDYSKFKVTKLNRELDKSQILKVKNSISEFGYLEYNPVIVNPEMEIIDGQHRFEACKALKLPIIYAIEKGRTDKIMIGLNTTQKNWTIWDYIEHYAAKWVKWYMYFLDFKKKHNLKTTVATAILTTHRSNVGRTIKSWFDFEKIAYADRIAEIINEFKFVLDFATSRSFVRAIIRLYVRGWEKGIKKLLENPMIITKQVNVFDYCNVFENIVNRGKHYENKISLQGKYVEDTTQNQVKWK